MCSKQKIRKVACCLLLVALISLIPSNTFRVLADGEIVPSFPYDELQTIGKNNYLLFRVHGIDEVDFVECIVPGRGIHGAFDSTLSGLSYSSLGGWVLQINAIDYCFKNGQKVDFDLQSLFTTSYMPVDNDDPYYSAWLEFVYTTSDIWGVDEDKISGYNVRFYKAQNFIIEPAATPTPTPETPVPTPELDNKFPTFINAYGTRSVGSDNKYNSNILVVNRYYDEVNTRYQYNYYVIYERYRKNILDVWEQTFIPQYVGYDFINNTFTIHFLNVATDKNYTGEYGSSFFTSTNYKTELDIYDLQHFNNIGNKMSETTERNYQFSVIEPYMNYEATAIYLINSDGLTTRLDGQGGGTSTPTPTPTSAPTPIPQPSATPAPEDPDKNSSWGWGIVNTLKYIFIPDKNKLIRLEKTTQTRFQQFGGGYDDLKRVSGFDDPVRPQNVVMNWKPFGTDSEEHQQQITLVDFEQIDFYLFQTSSGMFICDCLKASFTFLMFGYLIHVIRKHFVIENNTSEESDGGGD